MGAGVGARFLSDGVVAARRRKRQRARYRRPGSRRRRRPIRKAYLFDTLCTVVQCPGALEAEKEEQAPGVGAAPDNAHISIYPFKF